MNYNTQKGFTLIEMVAVLGIFGIVTSVVMFNHSKFQSDTILTNMAYEIALSIREAQIYGVSARNAIPGGVNTFSRPYGIYIPPVNPPTSQYFLFADTTPDLRYSGTDCAFVQGGDICATAYTLQRNILIESIYVKNGENCNLANKMSILFKRPNPEPIVNIDINPLTFSQVQITVKAPDGAKRYVIVANNGQISVENQPICGT
jgi:prepilin-type N-terminal cleavage/methylation domain-containing protein